MFVAIYCASSMPHNQKIIDTSQELANALAVHNFNIVYGGANVGLMKIVADSALDHGAQVIGVLPNVIKRKEIEKTNLTQLIKVETMHERKKIMADIADAFIALPGGAGTLDEIFEAITWSQINIHDKPTIFFNIDGYYDPIKSFFQNSLKNGLTSQANYDRICFIDNTNDLIDLLKRKLRADS
ncbi:MAG TPA: TIGR00730 family Rossman fold protein [Erysipelothrix sp.]